jgi:hypothetical protein
MVTVIIMSAVLITLFIIFGEEGGFGVGPVIVDENVLPDDQNQVVVSPNGVYSVRYDIATTNSSTSIGSISVNATTLGRSAEKLFAELALTMLPPWYTASRMAMRDVLQAETLKPSNVKNARQVLLTTRDLLDVFSPVYPGRSMWGNVRNLYKDGYELVGYYQDLDHAHVAYSKPLWEQRKNDILSWKRHFEFYDAHHDIHSFLRNDVDRYGCFDHSESHLFWGELDGYLPCGNDMATESLQKLAKVQLNNAMDLLATIVTYDTVLDDYHQETFHDFRKEIRSVLDEWGLFGTTLFPTADEPKSRVRKSLKLLKQAHKLLGKVNDNWTAYHFYKEKRSHKAERKKLAIEINTGWDGLKDWLTSVNLAGAIQDLLNVMQY